MTDFGRPTAREQYRYTRLGGHFLDVWQDSLPVETEVLRKLETLLDNRERLRADSMRNKAQQNRFVAVRGLLRSVLAEYLEIAPEALRFMVGPHGKPALTVGGVFFNLSHSADRLAIAVSDLEEIGIDIERIRPRAGLRQIAARCFSDREFREWSGLPQEERLSAFYGLWTKKEAFVKAVGRGISLGLERCEVDLSCESAFAGIPDAYGRPADWRVTGLLSSVDYCGAVVAPNVAFELREFCFNEV